MKVLVAGANGYIGSHVTKMFVETGFEVSTYSRTSGVQPHVRKLTKVPSDFDGYFDIVINCARPHWSEFSPEEIADIEFKLLMQLDRLAAEGATKIHTSGVWLFGNASQNDLKEFNLRPLEAVKLDTVTIGSAIKKKWHVVYCPSLVYGGENCQLKRIVDSLPDQTLQVAVPSQGYNQYIHVNDIARFYVTLVQGQRSTTQHFIAESEGYSPEAFSQLLLDFQIVKQVSKSSWSDFEKTHGSPAVAIEKLNLKLPISPLFEPTESLRKYIENYT
ncbi:NAD(P)-dependent oxidoreductase [Vibrio parahaemolyticus]|uniref:NAD-dependent epimerase/dehydratase family protein n=1 Tax=Vibrio parahaemolyticus TaxID=670 RepID=UPI0010D71704|nr:NAD(P)-dependent oxidoreductase [Vibrio parahaemolyticus]EJE4188836.1 NAD(P)-dependent oxidoreductase [Vibrio parahaemolyticus]MBE3709977.1 NAD(P)-dependent oxidoreductase [Vibrio parahaemolyticus]MBE4254461.1 NAD(P)-dependent oxidoreductase [Vibrio parahaemolyticus]MBE4259152.1 NAD(P)-dependent oxidoreductase [Vibrio parahaemolyticus]TBT84481.1 NAD(P)-dependent oxidoreductase [Vibrio parahaemolyticus]